MTNKEHLGRRNFLRATGMCSAGLYFGKIIDHIKPVEPDDEEKKINPETNENVDNILKHYRPLGFDKKGNLINLCHSRNELRDISIIPTNRNLFPEERRKTKDVKLLVVHFDAGDRFRENGVERNALNTVWGLNGNDGDGDGKGPSVQWCVDSFPIENNDQGDKPGYGVLQTQLASGDPQRPYRGRHVSIDPLVDANRIKTAEKFKKIGIRANLNEIVEKEITDFDGISVGFEQIGIYFDEGFPHYNQPPARQIANVLSLTIAAMRQFDLSPWDVVGHQEIQQKRDPGNYHMATLRVLLGIAALKGFVSKELVFKGSKDPYDYFKKVEEYLSDVDRYGRFYDWRYYIGLNKLLESVE